MAEFREFIFPTWIRLTRINRKATRRSSDRGRLMQTATFVCGAVGLDTDLSFVYQLFTLMLCLMVSARLSLRFYVPKVTVKRKLPRYATAGEPFEYLISVTNLGNRIERDLSITDNPRVVPPSFIQFKNAKEPGEDTRNAYDRWIGFHRFVWLQRQNTGINVQTAQVADIQLRSTIEAKIKATPLRRGMVTLTSTTVLHPDPLGCSYGIIEFSHSEQLMVLPKRYRMARPIRFQGGRNFQPGGINSAWSIGESDEFVSLRDYRDGDPLRKIHWASTAKRAKPVVKEFQDEYFVRQGLVVDAACSDFNRLDDIISVAASLLDTPQNQDGLIDLCFLAESPKVITAGRGYAQTAQQLEALAMLTTSTGHLDDFLELLSNRAKLLSSCVFVLNGLNEANTKMVQAIEEKGVPIAIFMVVDDTDETAIIPDDVLLIHCGDVESGLANL